MNNIHIHKTLQLTFIIIIIVLLDFRLIFAENMKIVFSSDTAIGTINPLIFGNSILGHDLTHTGNNEVFAGHSNYGTGIWDPHSHHAVPEVISLARNTGMTIARFPGGSGSLFYNWKNTIGPLESRPNFLFGLDEFMKTAGEIGCQVIYTLPYITGSSADAADLVEYLNAPNDKSNRGGGIDWAEIRAKNGHPAPYGVKYFELGNEVNFGAPKKQIPGAYPVAYAKDYLEYWKKMKTIDESIKLGAVTVNSERSKGLSPWNEELFKAAGDSIDFLIDHTYVGSYGSNSKDVNPDKIFLSALTNLNEYENNYKKLSEHFEKVTGRKNIPIAVTEYNTGFRQEKPVPFRHSLGSALINAGLLQIFMRPENNILMANYWQFVNSYWGMIKNDDFMKGGGTYIKRPNYLVFEMFHNHFGDELIDVNISDNNVVGGGTEKNNILAGAKWKTKYFSGADVKVDNDNVEVIFNSGRDVNFAHVYKKVAVKPNTTYKLTGYLKAEDLRDLEGACLAIEDDRGWKKTHSAATTERVWGTTDWVQVELEYTTLSDATGVSVMVRRLSGKGIITGKVRLKGAMLVERKERGLKGAHALSVSASRTKDGKSVYLMVLNKNVYEDVAADFQTTDGNLFNTIDIWTLNGPTVQSVNEIDSNNVTIKHKSITVKDIRAFHYTFPAHSLSSLEFKLQ